MEKLSVILNGDQKTLVIRQGTALPLKEPQVINITGDIDTVINYVKKRCLLNDPAPNVIPNLQQFNPSTAIVTFDKKHLSISLDVNPQDYYGPKVSGCMELSDELKVFGINENQVFNREALVKLLRFNKRFFTDYMVHDTVLKAFQSLTLTGNTEIKAQNDTRGNKEAAFKKNINSEKIPTSFYLTIPIYKGQPPVKFLVEVCLDSSESSVVFWFESVELKEIQDTTVDKVFNEQKEFFKNFVIVNK